MICFFSHSCYAVLETQKLHYKISILSFFKENCVKVNMEKKCASLIILTYERLKYGMNHRTILADATLTLTSWAGIGSLDPIHRYRRFIIFINLDNNDWALYSCHTIAKRCKNRQMTTKLSCFFHSLLSWYCDISSQPSKHNRTSHLVSGYCIRKCCLNISFLSSVSALSMYKKKNVKQRKI